MLRAHVAFVEFKAADGAAPRQVRGIATTPTPDRHGDVIDPLGATWTNPVPLLWHHDSERPIGTATLERPTATGIPFTGLIPTIPTAGALRDRVDEAWDTVQAGLIRGASIGFRILDGGVQILKSGGRRLSRIEICELSLVTIPANFEATIQTIKTLDAPYLAALGPDRSGASDRPTGRPTMTTAEQITQFKDARAAKIARMGVIMHDIPAEGLPDDKQTEYDGLALDVKRLDADLVRMADFEKLQTASAIRVDPSFAGTARGAAAPIVSGRITPNAPPGLTWVRSVKSLLQAKGDSYRALEYAKQYGDSNVELLIKAAVSPGSTTDPAWAGALVTVSNLTNEFIELSRAATILGKIPGIKKVPFNTSVPIVTAGGTYKWVGQGKAKPVTKMQFGSASLGMSKAAGIIVLTEELVRSSQPSAEMIVRDEMVKGIAAFLDQQFTDPAVAAVADTNPASITNGSPTAASLDDPAKDLGLIIGYFTTNNVPLGSIAIIMSEANAFAMGYGRNAMGAANFPGVGPTGGTANGITIVASNTVGDKVIGVAADRILLADDGGVTIDVSREASIQMNDAPGPDDPATTVWSSLWQDNLVGLRAERFINWKKAGTTSVYYLTGAAYPVI